MLPLTLEPGTSGTHTKHPSTEDLIEHLSCLWNELQRVDEHVETKVSRLNPTWRRSALNMLQYVELRKHDIRPLQDRLASLGLSSLGRAEAHVTASLKAVLGTLCHLANAPMKRGLLASKTIDYNEGIALSEAHASALLAPPPARRHVRIMVTMPSEAATNPKLVRDLLAAGMNCMRINCAHDNETRWAAMIENLRAAERELGVSCQVLMDLAGPKLRTGAIQGKQVVKCSPHRDERGRVLSPSRIYLFPAQHEGALPEADAHLPLDSKFIEDLQSGDELRLTDTRGARRVLRIVEAAGACRWAECTHTVYFEPGLKVKKNSPVRPLRTAVIGEIPNTHGIVRLNMGDTLILTAVQTPGADAIRDTKGHVISPAVVPCTEPNVFSFVKAGESIALDDGKIGGEITSVTPERIEVRITLTPPGGAKLGVDKGINLPQTVLDLPALTEEDLANIPFVATHADLVGMSFVERPADIRQLQERIFETGGKHLGLILKIETRRAFQALPALIVAAMHYPCAGVMIARGDLAVEVGFERMAEVQEEILWLCEAAHMPVIWATQVLESMAKSGLPSRAEITDAAMGERAECVMLNKGPHILLAIRALNDILVRMEGHQHKKRALLRRLQSWDHASAVCTSVAQVFSNE